MNNPLIGTWGENVTAEHEMEQIGRYKIESVLGQGAMGRVCLAFDPLLGRKVAIKTIRMDRLEHEDRDQYKDRFFREARICGQLRNEHIVGIFDVGEHLGNPFIVMEYVPGISLMDHLSKRRDSSLVLLNYLDQLAKGLEDAHKVGIVHRDIKPANIIITPEGVLKILDFGIARFSDSHLTSSGVFLGTPRYASPEQVSGATLTHSSDLFSFAVMAHEMFTGDTPFASASLSSLLFKIAHGEPDILIPGRMPDRAQPKYRNVFIKALNKSPEQRYQSATLLMAALRLAISNENFEMVEIERTVSISKPESANRDRSSHEEMMALQKELEGEMHQANLREERIRLLRHEFQQALRTHLLDACILAIQGLDAENTDCLSEKKALALLREKLRVQKELDERNQAVMALRSNFRDQLQNHKPDEATVSLQTLKQLDTSITLETDLLENYYQKDRDTRRHQVQNDVRARLNEALLAANLIMARQMLTELEKMGVALPSDISAVDQLVNNHVSGRPSITQTQGRIDGSQPPAPTSLNPSEGKSQSYLDPTSRAGSTFREQKWLLMALVFAVLVLSLVWWTRAKTPTPGVDAETPITQSKGQASENEHSTSLVEIKGPESRKKTEESNPKASAHPQVLEKAPSKLPSALNLPQQTITTQPPVITNKTPAPVVTRAETEPVDQAAQPFRDQQPLQREAQALTTSPNREMASHSPEAGVSTLPPDNKVVTTAAPVNTLSKEITVPKALYRGFKHQPKKSMIIPTKSVSLSCQISITEPALPTFYLCWRVGNDPFKKLRMQQDENIFTSQIPAHELRMGTLEYYFLLSLPSQDIRLGEEIDNPKNDAHDNNGNFENSRYRNFTTRLKLAKTPGY